MSKLVIGAFYYYAGNRYEITHVSLKMVFIAKSIGGLISQFTISEFTQFLFRKHIELLLPNDRVFNIPDEALEPREVNTRNFRYDVVTEVLAKCPVYSRPNDENVISIISRVSKKHNVDVPPSISTVSRWIKTFNDAGQSPNSLLPKPKNHRTHFPLEIEQIIEDMIITAYEDEKSINETRLAGDILFELNKYKGNQEVSIDFEIPSLRTLRRRIHEAPVLLGLANKYGKKSAKRMLRAAGASRPVYWLLQYVEIDGHHLKVRLVDTSTGEELGVAYLTLAIDRYSRCILGYVISYVPFSSSTLLLALKQVFNQDNGLPGGKVSQLVFDNGSDYISNSVRDFIGFTRSIIAQAPPSDPNFKAHVERVFNTISIQLIDSMRGSTRISGELRLQKPPKEMAILSIDELREQLDLFIDAYHRTIHEGIQRPPLKMWRQAAKKQYIHQIDPKTLDVQAKLVKSLTINKGRIRSFKRAWFSHALRSLEMTLNQRNLPRKVKVFFDESDVTTIHIQNPLDRHQVIEARITKEWDLEGLTLSELEMLNERLKEENLDPEFLTKEQALLLRARNSRELWESVSAKSKRKVAAITDGKRAEYENTLKEHQKEVEEITYRETQRQMEELKIFTHDSGIYESEDIVLGKH